MLKRVFVETIVLIILFNGEIWPDSITIDNVRHDDVYVKEIYSKGYEIYFPKTGVVLEILNDETDQSTIKYASETERTKLYLLWQNHPKKEWRRKNNNLMQQEISEETTTTQVVKEQNISLKEPEKTNNKYILTDEEKLHAFIILGLVLFIILYYATRNFFVQMKHYVTDLIQNKYNKIICKYGKFFPASVRRGYLLSPAKKYKFVSFFAWLSSTLFNLLLLLGFIISAFSEDDDSAAIIFLGAIGFLIYWFALRAWLDRQNKF